MKHFYLLLICCTMATLPGRSQNFDAYFLDKTLRIDYLFTGDAHRQDIVLDELSQLPAWAGRRERLAELPLQGDGQLIVKDAATKKELYKTSFSSLFQEWLTTDEAQHTARGFENTFLVPYPRETVEIEISLFDKSGKVQTAYKHTVNPTDVLIRQCGMNRVTPHRWLIKNGNQADCIDVAILAEGYTAQEMETFYKDAQTACESLFEHEPFRSQKAKFNIVAIGSPSADSGVSIPERKEWRQTAVHSHFNTFYSPRYLTTSRVKAIHNLLAGIPYEHIIILANTETYGGGGIYNSFTLTTAHHPMFKPVVVHEFGHSFAGLADEYFYDNDVMNGMYPPDREPWEQNITTLTEFDRKWKDMLPQAMPVPTPAQEKNKYKVGLYEGGGYASKGIYRPAFDCRMRTNEYPEFCPVCQRAILRLIQFYTR